MPQQESAESVTLDRRRAVFLAVVEAQDQGKTVAESRAEAARRFGVSEEQVKAIEAEGLDHNWPPL